MSFKNENYMLLYVLFLILVACNKENIDSPVVLSDDNNPKLGIVYDADYLRKILIEKHNESQENYTLGGLVFKNIVENEFTLEALYFNSSKPDAFCSDPIENPIRTKKYFVSISNDTLTDEGLIFSETQQNLIKQEAKLEYWDVMSNPQNRNINPFVFFSKSSLELILSGNVKKVTFTGAQINYGSGIRNTTIDAVDNRNPSSYPTLKAESNLDNNNKDKYIPNVAIAIPCPTLWPEEG